MLTLFVQKLILEQASSVLSQVWLDHIKPIIKQLRRKCFSMLLSLVLPGAYKRVTALYNLLLKCKCSFINEPVPHRTEKHNPEVQCEVFPSWPCAAAGGADEVSRSSLLPLSGRCVCLLLGTETYVCIHVSVKSLCCNWGIHETWSLTPWWFIPLQVIGFKCHGCHFAGLALWRLAM